MESLFALHLIDSNPEDVDLAQQVFEGSLPFLKSLEGHDFVPENVASECMESIPEGMAPEKKKTFALVSEEGVCAYYEYLTHFPEQDTMYLGLLLIPEQFKKKDLSSEAFALIEKQFKIVHKAKKIRTTYVECTGMGPFWKKMGFKECAHRTTYEHGQIRSEYVVMEKILK